MNPDQELVEAVLARKPGAFERLVATHQGLCWHIILRLVRHPEDARDLCQEAFLRVHQFLHQFRYDCALKSWIGRVAYMVALRHLEKQRIPVVSADADDDGDLLASHSDGFDLESALVDHELAGHLHAAIDALPPVQRTILTLYHLEELSIPDIAQVTGMAVGTIKSHLFRTRLQLRQWLENRLGVMA
ncbi:RNA polymerase sigma factor [Tahibacter amnicola]|uniref:Sigma-70 family RNA polymerase sigma factor n=1 Tax=Tahibacter amnicola TaxID=2976241 RepID=A0ABY6BF60_9GAMM|nr:sigma-70 family RNA polymerase sigma factor [Tahibacter amnicola]UXI66507.1 sigma-70 family RNA polymerase sigma factor [Tahibacter amnicola]